MPPLAERLHPEHAKDLLESAMYRREPEGLLQSAWHHIEFALNQQIELNTTDKYELFDTASFLLGSILDGIKYKNPIRNPIEVPDETYFKAMVVNSYLPIFTKRALDHPLTADDSRQLYASLGKIIQLKAASPYPLGMSEDVAQGLSARTMQPSYILHLASPREEHTQHQPVNHDGYFFDNYDSPKMPVQIKLGETALRYDSPIVILDLRDILATAARVTHLDECYEEDVHLGFLPIAADLIADETQQHSRLLTAERQFLNLSSRAIVRHYRQARDEAATFMNTSTA